jgi:hypothetical protein
LEGAVIEDPLTSVKWKNPFANPGGAILKSKSIRKQSKAESILVESRWLNQDE